MRRKINNNQFKGINMKKILSFFAMSAIVLGMAFTFNACGGNDANNPEPPENPEVNNEYFNVA